MVDLGRPWNIWRPIFHRNLHSPLFEVAMCVMLYTTVLALEFAPVVLERFAWAQPVVRLLRRLTLPLVILGIALSTLHQSSLGTLFLLSEARMHPLWFSPAAAAAVPDLGRRAGPGHGHRSRACHLLALPARGRVGPAPRA